MVSNTLQMKRIGELIGRSVSRESQRRQDVPLRHQLDGAPYRRRSPDEPAADPAPDEADYILFDQVRFTLSTKSRSKLSGRNTLYPKLQNHEAVLAYPDVRGMGRNVYFLLVPSIAVQDQADQQ